MNNTCENYQTCPIYSGVLQGLQFTSETYRKMYCDADSQGWSRCKRYQVKKRIGSCPEGILPNSNLSVEEIIAQHSGQAAT